MFSKSSKSPIRKEHTVVIPRPCEKEDANRISFTSFFTFDENINMWGRNFEHASQVVFDEAKTILSMPSSHQALISPQVVVSARRERTK